MGYNSRTQFRQRTIVFSKFTQTELPDSAHPNDGPTSDERRMKLASSCKRTGPMSPYFEKLSLIQHHIESFFRFYTPRLSLRRAASIAPSSPYICLQSISWSLPS
jgi:hypothetical protein